MKLLVDGIFNRISNTGISRVWQSMLPLLASEHGIEVLVLDRGGMRKEPGVTYIPFGTTSYSAHSTFNYCPADSFLIQQICDHYSIDVFTSTFYTSPIRTPTVLVIYDMIPELFDFNLKQSVMMEKEMAISYAQRYVCISECTKRDLISFYPEIPESHVKVAYCGVDRQIFHRRSQAEIEEFKIRWRLSRPYFLFVGSRIQHGGYKNSKLFFDALKSVHPADFDVMCVGGEHNIERTVLEGLPAEMCCRRVDLTDVDLAIAYSAAEALVYPSLYEGFGMPVIEAMACACPVITTHCGALREAAGSAACVISGTSIPEMAEALTSVRVRSRQEELRAAGLIHASAFDWGKIAEVFAGECRMAMSEVAAGSYKEFFKLWAEHRAIQAGVDYEWIPPIQ